MRLNLATPAAPSRAQAALSHLRWLICELRLTQAQAGERARPKPVDAKTVRRWMKRVSARTLDLIDVLEMELASKTKAAPARCHVCPLAKVRPEQEAERRLA